MREMEVKPECTVKKKTHFFVVVVLKSVRVKVRICRGKDQYRLCPVSQRN